jgi:hypothetical protein
MQIHYWIREGRIDWAGAWTPEKIEAGRQAEEGVTMLTLQLVPDNVAVRCNRSGAGLRIYLTLVVDAPCWRHSSGLSYCSLPLCFLFIS